MKTQLCQKSQKRCLKNNSSDTSRVHDEHIIVEFDLEMDDKVAIKAAVPKIPTLPNEPRKDVLAHAILLIEFILLNQNHR